MSFLVAVIGSITTATRFAKKLEQLTGISVRIVHTPEELGSAGCSYSLKTRSEYLPIVMDTAAKNKVKVKGYYLEEKTEGKVVYHAIS